jgi:hypothetical protein
MTSQAVMEERMTTGAKRSGPAAGGAGPASGVGTIGAFIEHVCAVSRAGLPLMFRPETGRFIFCRRRHPSGIHPEGDSRRYTAITSLGLINETPESVAEILHGSTVAQVCRGLIADIETVDNLGDVALTLWVANLLDLPERTAAYDRLNRLHPLTAPQYTVELAWALSALCHEPHLTDAHREFRDALARRLLGAFHPRGQLFPHRIGDGGSLRGHVGCFADQVYPIQALSFYAQQTGDAAALDAAARTGRRICERIGPAGQWWWHYDARTGAVTEGYPVYSVHQNSMAPMALFALQEAGGGDFRSYIVKGLEWLRRTPELKGASLVDPENRVIWRKVARREPGKLTRQLQAAASRLHASLRVPMVDVMFPPTAVDWECRPYHLGWVLYTWTAARRAMFAGGAAGHPFGGSGAGR